MPKWRCSNSCPILFCTSKVAAYSPACPLLPHPDTTTSRALIRSQRLGESHDGDANIWMRAILDDARRDIATFDYGALRDIALAGAVRKGAQSARVSYETAFLVAERVGGAEQAASELRRLRNAWTEHDDGLAAALQLMASSL